MRKLQEVIQSVKVVEHPSPANDSKSSSNPAANKPCRPPAEITQADQTPKNFILSSTPEMLERGCVASLLKSQFLLDHQRTNFAVAEGTAGRSKLKENKQRFHSRRRSVRGRFKSLHASDINKDEQDPSSCQRLAIKVTYKDDIIRFQLPPGSGLHELLQEVKERLKVNVEFVHVKYLDPDAQWVTLACDADFYMCIKKLKGGNLIRLTIDDNSGGSYSRSSIF